METWRAIMTKGAYSADASTSLSLSSKASRYGVLDDESDKLAQPLISRRDSADASYYAHYDYDSDRMPEYGHDSDFHDDHDALERDALLRKARGYDEIPLKPSPVALLRSLVQNVLWPMTAVGAQTAKVFQPRRTATTMVSTPAPVAYEVEDRNALRTVTTLRALAKPRARRAETLDEIHERALVRIALATVVFSAWLIITVYRHAD